MFKVQIEAKKNVDNLCFMLSLIESFIMWILATKHSSTYVLLIYQITDKTFDTFKRLIEKIHIYCREELLISILLKLN